MTKSKQAPPAGTAVVWRYMTTLPQIAAGLPRHGQGITFPGGRESVKSAGSLRAPETTVSFWFKTDSPNTGICLPSIIASLFLQDGSLGVLNGGWPCNQPPGANLADGQWHHVALKWQIEPRSQTLYADGVQVAVSHGPPVGFSGSVILGRANVNGRFLDGTLDEFRVYSRTLSDEEIQKLYWKVRSSMAKGVILTR